VSSHTKKIWWKDRYRRTDRIKTDDAEREIGVIREWGGSER